MASRRSFLATALAVPAAGGLALSSTTDSKPKTAALQYRVLGKTGLKVTGLGFGSEAVSDVSVVRQALDMGLNYFDTAHAYQGGNNERTLGAALGADRQKVVVSSRSYVNDRKVLEAELDLSLKELKTDYLDIWFLGSHDKPVSDELLTFQESAKKAGKFRFAGLSTHKPWAMVDFIKKSRFDVVMFPYNFAMGSPHGRMHREENRIEAALDEFQKMQLGVVAIKVMAGGHRRADAPSPFISALRWVLSTPQIHSCSVRMHDREQLEENMRAMEAPFSNVDEKTLTAHLERISPVYCRMCYECEGKCEQGLPVADVLRFLMYADGYKRFDLGYENFKALPASARAVRCEDCGQCSVACPNGVAVRKRLLEAQRMFA